MCLNVPLRGLQHTCTTVVCVQFFSSLPVFQKQPAQEFAMSCNIPKLHPTPTLSHCSRHTRGKSRCCMATRSHSNHCQAFFSAFWKETERGCGEAEKNTNFSAEIRWGWEETHRQHCEERPPHHHHLSPPPLLTTRSSKWRSCDGNAENRTVILLILSSAVTQSVCILSQETIYQGQVQGFTLLRHRTREETRGGNFTAHCLSPTLGWSYHEVKNIKEPSENPSSPRSDLPTEGYAEAVDHKGTTHIQMFPLKSHNVNSTCFLGWGVSSREDLLQLGPSVCSGNSKSDISHI